MSITTETTRAATPTIAASTADSCLGSQRLIPTASGGATRDVLVAFVGSRLLVFAASFIGAWVLPHGPFMLPSVINRSFFGGWPLSSAFDHVFSPLIRGDALTYVLMPVHGYNVPGMSALQVYFPGYPGLVAILGGFASPGAAAIVGSVVSLVSFLGSLWVLHRLVTLDFGAAVARATILLLAFSPWAYFFSAPYTESLFLLLTVSALYAARTEHWAAAGLCAACASATRNSGALLIVPLVLLYLYGPGRPVLSATASWRRLATSLRRVRPKVLWLGLAPAGLAAYSVYLQLTLGDALAWSHLEAAWGRVKEMPWDGVYLGLRAAWHAVDGTPPDAVYRLPALVDMTALVVVGACLLVAWRRLPIAYSAYATLVVLATLSAVSHWLVPEPLISFPRYSLVLFPLFMATALICEARRLTRFVVPASAVGLAVLSALFAAGYPYF